MNTNKGIWRHGRNKEWKKVRKGIRQVGEESLRNQKWKGKNIMKAGNNVVG